MSEESITLTEVYADYAKKAGHEPLTYKEKQQAFLDAVLAGKLIEPFAIFSQPIAMEQAAIEWLMSVTD